LAYRDIDPADVNARQVDLEERVQKMEGSPKKQKKSWPPGLIAQTITLIAAMLALVGLVLTISLTQPAACASCMMDEGSATRQMRVCAVTCGEKGVKSFTREGRTPNCACNP